MVRLADLRQPDEIGAPWEDFIGRASVRDLDWPHDVVEQFLFAHAANPAFQCQYGHLALERLSWTLDELAASEFARVTWTVNSLGGRVEDCERETEPAIEAALRATPPAPRL
jgi:hypothetical protein